MTDPGNADPVPFWKRKGLADMTPAEWESLCDGCGRCCLQKLRANDSKDVYYMDVGCQLLDPATAACSDYANRLARNVGCWQMTPADVSAMDWMPSTCGYRLVSLGQDLASWHPLVSGDRNSVRQAGMSAGGRFSSPDHTGRAEYHTVDWPNQPATDAPGRTWQKSMFGGITAAVPTPFRDDNQVDLDLMANHCFWLLSNGCNGLMVLDAVGEVASLARGERIAILEGLAARGVPMPKLLVGIGATPHRDAVQMAERALRLGIRGVMVPVPLNDRTLPQAVLSPAVRATIAAMPESLHLYLSFAPGPRAVAACMTALETFMSIAPLRVTGIRDTSADGALALAALDRFGCYPFEVYGSEPGRLAEMIARGASGLIGPAGNLVAPHSRAILQGGKPEQTAPVQACIHAVGQALRPRPLVPSIKALLARNSGIPAWERVRLPLRRLRADQRESLFQAFDATGARLRPIIADEQQDIYTGNP